MLELELAKIIQENPGLKVYFVTYKVVRDELNFFRISESEFKPPFKIEDVWWSDYDFELYTGNSHVFWGIERYLIKTKNLPLSSDQDFENLKKEVMKKYESEVKKGIVVNVSLVRGHQ